MESIQDEDLLVTLPYGRYAYSYSIFMLVTSFFIGLNAFFDLSVIYYILFVAPFVPFLVISLRSQNRKHALIFGDSFLSIGGITLHSDQIKRIIIYKPFTIYIHETSNVKKAKKAITIQTNPNHAERVMNAVQGWAQDNNINLEINY